MLLPNGIWNYLIGGALIGIGISFIYILTGFITGASSNIDSILSLISNKFSKKHSKYRILLLMGLMLGAFIYTFFTNSWTQTSVAYWRLLIGGIFVGFGTRLGRGCTSGHGICGIASLSKSSFINVIIFVTVAIITANIVKILGVIP
mgnify:CR=1 FL=1|jgi:uncharacterized protein